MRYVSASSLRCAARQKIQHNTPTIPSGTTADARMIRFSAVDPELPDTINGHRKARGPGGRPGLIAKESVAMASDPSH